MYTDQISKSAVNQASSPEREREVPQVIQGLAGSINWLETNVERLADRLAPVMRPPSPYASGDSGRPTGTALGGEISMQEKRIARIAAYLSDVCDRLEL